MRKSLYLLPLLAFAPLYVHAHDISNMRPDDHAPAGVMADHLHKEGEFMVGYRHMYSVSDGDTLKGSSPQSDAQLAAAGFSGKTESMTMNMQMLDIMYAPRDWLTFMVMPQYVSMDMSMTGVAGAAAGGGHAGHGGGAGGSMQHSVEGLGDTTMAALFGLYNKDGHKIIAGLGMSAPTGSVYERDAGVMQHYGMQLGSGTWDFLPSLTYRGTDDKWGWGAQASAIKRLNDYNLVGFRFGDQFQFTGWGSRQIADWLSTSLRFQYTAIDAIDGHYNQTHNHSSPPDFQPNYGGQFLDVGFGFNTVIREGELHGVRMSAEWLQPVGDYVNGTQQERTGTLHFGVSRSF